MRRFVGLLVVTVIIVVLSSPAAAQAAATNLSITNIDLPSNTVKVQIITVGAGMGDVTVTVPYDLRSIIFVRRAGEGACPGDGTVYVCPGDPGEIEVLYQASPLSSGLLDNEALTVTAQSSGITVSGTVTIRRSTDLSVGWGSFSPLSENTAYLQVSIANHGPDRASGVQVYVDGVDPRVWVSSGFCDRSGARIVCSLAQVPTSGSMVLVNLTRCAVTSPVTVSVSTTTTELNPGNNSGTVPALSDGSKTCDQYFSYQVPGSPPGGGSGGGSGSEAGTGSTAGVGSASGTLSAMASGPAAPSESSSTTGSSSVQPGAAPDAPSAARAAADRPGNSTPVGLLVGIATLLLAGGGAAWLRLRRSTVQTPTPD